MFYIVQVRGNNGSMRSAVGPVPLELKTGRTTFSAEHKGQVVLTDFRCTFFICVLFLFVYFLYDSIIK